MCATLNRFQLSSQLQITKLACAKDGSIKPYSSFYMKIFSAKAVAINCGYSSRQTDTRNTLHLRQAIRVETTFLFYSRFIRVHCLFVRKSRTMKRRVFIVWILWQWWNYWYWWNFRNLNLEISDLVVNYKYITKYRILIYIH